jgi:L-threonylcarbamoyladenylate synthase
MRRVTWESASGPWLLDVAQVIREGGVAVLPTDTLYGFTARFDDAAAVERVAAAKGREAQSPFLLLVSETASLGLLARELPPAEVLDRLWPGPVTVLCAGRAEIGRRFLGERGTIAVRRPGTPLLVQLLQAIAVPVLSTSVNRVGQAPLTDPARIAAEFGPAIDLLADGGPRSGAPSAIVDLSRRPPVLVRAGAHPIDLVELERRWQRADQALEGGVP